MEIGHSDYNYNEESTLNHDDPDDGYIPDDASHNDHDCNDHIDVDGGECSICGPAMPGEGDDGVYEESEDDDDDGMDCYRLGSSALCHAPGMVRFFKHMFKTGDKNDQLVAIRGLGGGWNLSVNITLGLLEDNIKPVIEGDVVVVTVKRNDYR